MNSPKLIDENKLIEWLTKPTGFRTNCEDCPTTGCIDCIIEEAIKNTPTAYDIDKVVEQLEDELKTAVDAAIIFDGDYFNGLVEGLEKAIEIVKGGVK